jgi:hypothetical protein
MLQQITQAESKGKNTERKDFERHTAELGSQLDNCEMLPVKKMF